MIESTQQTKQIGNKKSYLIKRQNLLPSRAKISCLEMVPVFKNTHVAFFPDSYGYSQQLIHFDTSGKKIQTYSFQGASSQIGILSPSEFVIYQQIIKFNGDYKDYIYLYNLIDHSVSQCRYFGSDDENYKISINLIVFQEIKIICLAEATYQSDMGKPPVALSYKITYYQPQEIYKKDTPANKKWPTHTFNFKIKQNEKKKTGFRLRKLNQKGMIAHYYQQIQNNLIQFYAYNYKSKQKGGQISQFQFNFFQENQLDCYNIEQIWQLNDDLFYVKLLKNQKQAQMKKITQLKTFQKDLIIYNKQRKYIKIETENKVPFDIQFIDHFRQIKPKKQKTTQTKPVQLVILHLYHPILLIESKLFKDFTETVFINNKIYQYQIDGQNLSIHETPVNARIPIQLIVAFLVQSLIQSPSDALVEQIIRLVKEP